MEINRYHLKSPIEVATTKIGIPQEYKQRCIDEIYKIGDKQNHQTNVKALMSSYAIWEETKVLNELISNIFTAILKIYPKADDRFKWTITNCWSAIYKKGHHTIPHQHLPAYLSFTYYLKSTLQSSPLVFEGCDFKIQPHDDLLVVFPSHIYHSVPPQTNDEDRVCLAGNLDLTINK